VSDRLALFTAGLLAETHAKTAHGILRYGEREVVAVVDDAHAGRRVPDVVPYARRDVPVVATVAEAADRGANVLVVGVAPLGGALTPEWRAVLVGAARAGMALEAGLHTELAGEPELAGAEVRDLRAAPPDLSVPAGPAHRPDVRVVHTVGSDCAIGKMSVTLELDAAARARGIPSAFVPTGQTGIAIAGWGIAVDEVVSDFVAGASERLVLEGRGRSHPGALLWIEGQGSISHPSYSGVTLGLLHGSAPHALILVHEAGRTHIDMPGGPPIPPLPELIEDYQRIARYVRAAPVVAVSLKTNRLDDAAARQAIAAAEQETGLPADDPVRFGAGKLLEAIIAALPG
jgi:D-glutamate N-acetyltransferase